MVLYPMFVHMYLELVYKGSEKEGRYYIKKSNNLGCAYSCACIQTNVQMFCYGYRHRF